MTYLIGECHLRVSLEYLRNANQKPLGDLTFIRHIISGGILARLYQPPDPAKLRTTDACSVMSLITTLSYWTHPPHHPSSSSSSSTIFQPPSLPMLPPTLSLTSFQ
mmetsp:Transcript_35283/g.53422  ORF Transcript_35283/g.53422 Transcript_35283/m.53422 type:complete len:106 (+) Transcript_35283:924-1241(+)